MTTRKVAQEGHWYAIPLMPHGFATVVVARAKRGVLLGYFFGPVHAQPPCLSEVCGLAAGDSVLVAKFGDVGIRTGEWPSIGYDPGWNRDVFPMPLFATQLAHDGSWASVKYDPEDPNSIPAIEPVSEAFAATLPADGTGGHKYIEAVLSEILRSAD